MLDSSVVILVPPVIPVSPLCHSRPHSCHSRTPSVIPAKAGIQSVISGSPIRSASLSVEDDKGCVIPAFFSVIPAKAGIQSEWIPHQVRDDKECVIPAQAGIQTEWIPNPKRFAFG